MNDIIVVGAGHAGCEAAIIAAKMKKRVFLITSNINNIADLPCNPSIGGSAKGIVVKEIDALGGVMGEVADQSQIQIKKLNIKKGPAVQALRAQIDKPQYQANMKRKLAEYKNITIVEDMIEDVIVENNQIIGVIGAKEYFGKAVILTTGTFLKADILIGNQRKRSGPGTEKPSLFLSDNLKKQGLSIIRLKTGTPPRIEKKTIDFSKTTEEKGDPYHLYFSNFFKNQYDLKKQQSCYLTYTNDKTHQIILDNLNKSSMYGGIEDLASVGPRYCPSIEDKIVRFREKPRHQLFLEPISLTSDEIYIQGFSTSLPIEVQQKIVKTLPGLEESKILKYAYAIEYDAVMPTQLKLSLETKKIANLFLAGQINGTSGYEEAAGQGLMAGINACLKINKQEPFVLKRNEAYIGVLIDDLINKGVRDPYRLLTSRAEHRLLLRSDNAASRLCKYGQKYQTLEKEKIIVFEKKEQAIIEGEQLLRNFVITPKDNEILKKLETTTIKDKSSLYQLLKRSEITLKKLIEEFSLNISQEIIEQLEIKTKYEGYIKKASAEALKMLKLENKVIPNKIDYQKIPNLASEARQKLIEVQPTSLGQASRISGVNPADIAILAVYIKKGISYE